LWSRLFCACRRGDLIFSLFPSVCRGRDVLSSLFLQGFSPSLFILVKELFSFCSSVDSYGLILPTVSEWRVPGSAPVVDDRVSSPAPRPLRCSIAECEISSYFFSEASPLDGRRGDSFPVLQFSLGDSTQQIHAHASVRSDFLNGIFPFPLLRARISFAPRLLPYCLFFFHKAFPLLFFPSGRRFWRKL